MLENGVFWNLRPQIQSKFSLEVIAWICYVIESAYYITYIFLKMFLTLTCSICICAAIKCFSVHKKLQSEHPYKTGVSSPFLFDSFSSISTGGKSGIVKIGADDECLYLCSVDFRLIFRVFFTRLSDRHVSPVSFNKIATSRSASWSAKSNPPIPKDGSRPTCWPLSFFTFTNQIPRRKFQKMFESDPLARNKFFEYYHDNQFTIPHWPWKLHPLSQTGSKGQFDREQS